MYIKEMGKLTPLELTYVIRGAEAENTLEYLHILAEMNMIKPENQATAMYLGMCIKDHPEQIQEAKAFLEYKREVEYRNYMQQLTGKEQEMPEPMVDKAEDVQQKQEQTKASLLIALKCAIEAAVYRAKAAVIAINNSAMKRAVASLEKVQAELNQFQELNSKSEDLRESIKTGKEEAELTERKEETSSEQEIEV